MLLRDGVGGTCRTYADNPSSAPSPTRASMESMADCAIPAALWSIIADIGMEAVVEVTDAAAADSGCCC